MIKRFFFFLFVFSGWHPWHMEVPRLGVQSELCSRRPAPEPQQLGIWAASATYTTVQGNTGSLTHWVRPGMEPTTSWLLVGLVNHSATRGTPLFCFLIVCCRQINPEVLPIFTLWNLKLYPLLIFITLERSHWTYFLLYKFFNSFWLNTIKFQPGPGNLSDSYPLQFGKELSHPVQIETVRSERGPRKPFLLCEKAWSYVGQSMKEKGSSCSLHISLSLESLGWGAEIT